MAQLRAYLAAYDRRADPYASAFRSGTLPPGWTQDQIAKRDKYVREVAEYLGISEAEAVRMFTANGPHSV
jgi:hypothetical protein